MSQQMLASLAPTPIENFVNGAHVTTAEWSKDSTQLHNTNKFIPVLSPYSGETISYCPISKKTDVDLAVAAAQEAFQAWGNRTMKDRAQIMIRFHQLVIKHRDELADLIVLEHGK
ncbi:hypothetical protein HDU81_004031, partial [Chytriomyces hyalinus]